MTKAALFLCFPAVSLAVAGCTPPIANGIDPNKCPDWNTAAPAPADPPNSEPPTRTVNLAACAGGATQADIDRNVKLADTIEKEFREQPACGVLARNYAWELSHWFANSACGNLTYPSGFSYNGSGYYLAGGFMGVQAKLAKDTSFGKAGDDVPFDLFAHGSYGAGPLTISATLSIDSSWSSTNVEDFDIHLKGTLDITQEEPKPEGLELWGIPADGKSMQKQQEELAKTIGESVYFSLDANISEFTSGSGVTYRFTSPDTTIDSTYNGKPIQFQLVSIDAKDPEINQTASLVSYDVQYVPLSHGPMKGGFTLKMEGGLFPYYVTYTYPTRITPDVLIECDPPVK